MKSCLLCKSTVRSSSNTRNAWQHLENHHANIFDDRDNYSEHNRDVNVNKLKKSNSSNGRQLSIQTAFNQRRNNVYGPDSKRRKMIDEKVMKYIVRSCRPFRTVEDKNFKDMIEFIDNLYTLPSRKKFSKKLLLELYQKTDSRLRDILQRSSMLR